MALGLDVKSSEPQLNIPKNEGQAIPINFVGQKKLPEQPKVIIEQPLIDQGIPTAPPAPELEANSNPIDSDKEEEEAIKEIEIGGLEAAVAQINREIVRSESQEPIAQAIKEKISSDREEYNRFAVKMAIIGGQKPYRPIMEDINRLPKTLIFINGIREIMAALGGWNSYKKVFGPENIAAAETKGLNEEEKTKYFPEQLLVKPKMPEIVKREPIQTSWGLATIEYKEAA